MIICDFLRKIFYWQSTVLLGEEYINFRYEYNKKDIICLIQNMINKNKTIIQNRKQIFISLNNNKLIIKQKPNLFFQPLYFFEGIISEDEDNKDCLITGNYKMKIFNKIFLLFGINFFILFFMIIFTKSISDFLFGIINNNMDFYLIENAIFIITTIIISFFGISILRIIRILHDSKIIYLFLKEIARRLG